MGQTHSSKGACSVLLEFFTNATLKSTTGPGNRLGGSTQTCHVGGPGLDSGHGSTWKVDKVTDAEASSQVERMHE